ncbi:MAG: hypothetical protein OEY59_03990 [Deltaproteobacteria bacterium]|nr:hypothetical protein [Deltaproteobacteria bacterium]
MKEVNSDRLISLNQYDKIYTLGPRGTFSDQAAELVGGTRIKEIRYTTTLPQIALEVEKDEKALGVIPVENSSSGVVEPAQDSLVESNVVIIYELMVEVSYSLVSHVPLDEITAYYCHSVAFNQTMMFAAKTIPGAEVIFSKSNIDSGKQFLINSDNRVAAIIPEQVARDNEEYRSKIMAEKIQDYKKNITRFFVVKKRPDDLKYDFTKNKTSIFVELHDDRHSLLFDLLREFHVFGINLCRLESRPSKLMHWRYTFYMDFYNNHRVEMCLAELKKQDIDFRYLGSYDHIVPFQK